MHERGRIEPARELESGGVTNDEGGAVGQSRQLRQGGRRLDERWREVDTDDLAADDRCDASRWSADPRTDIEDTIFGSQVEIGNECCGGRRTAEMELIDRGEVVDGEIVRSTDAGEDGSDRILDPPIVFESHGDLFSSDVRIL